MTMILPNEDITLEQFLASTSTQELSQLITQAQVSNPEIVFLHLPKFTCKSLTTRLKSTMKNLGVESIFEASIWNRITDDMPLMVSDILHSIFFSVDEKGVEGAAATPFEMCSAPGEDYTPPTPIPFYLNRPFMFIVRERNTGTPLFMGAVMNPANK